MFGCLAGQISANGEWGMEGGDKEKKRTNRQQSNRNLTKKKKGTRSRLARHVWADERLAAIQQGAQKDERLTGVSGDSGDSEESRDVPESGKWNLQQPQGTSVVVAAIRR